MIVYVTQGQCLLSIASETGHHWNTIWNDPANAELRSRRRPNILLPGDAVTIPPIEPRTESGATEQRHRFRRRGEPAVLRLTLLDNGEPRANAEYVLTIDGERREGRTDGEGTLAEPLPCGARRAVLRIGEEELDVQLGGVDPIEEPSGVRQRLENLGFAGPDAIRRFQESRGLEATGEADQATRDRLLQDHGG
jgi:N-acetylmuramoyl-L-alanine amidase